MTTKPPTRQVRASDVRPYKWSLWCTIEGYPEPIANDIVWVFRSNEGRKLSFMLESFNFLTVEPDAMLDLIPLLKETTHADS